MKSDSPPCRVLLILCLTPRPCGPEAGRSVPRRPYPRHLTLMRGRRVMQGMIKCVHARKR